MGTLIFFMSSAHLLYFGEEGKGSAIQKKEEEFFVFPFCDLLMGITAKSMGTMSSYCVFA